MTINKIWNYYFIAKLFKLILEPRKPILLTISSKSMQDQSGWLSFYFFYHSKFTPLTLPDPVFLHLFDAFWPIKSFKIINQSICIFCNLEYPLTKSPFLDTGSTSITSIESGHFFIRKTCFTAWTIVYRKILLIGKSSLEKLKKYPLCPLIIFWICRIYHTIPII